MHLEPYRRDHLERFTPGAVDIENAEVLSRVGGWEGKAVSAVEDGETLGICGIGQVDGVANVFLVLSDEMRTRPVTLTRWAMRSIPHILALPGVKRISIEIRHETARKWAEHLGFKHEYGERFRYD